MNGAKICPICGEAEPIENGVSVRGLYVRYSNEMDVQVCAYPGGGYTLLVWNPEGFAEIPLNFCPECGRGLRRKDGKRGEWIDTGDGGTHCSECGHDSRCNPTPFCPECGARMEQGDAAQHSDVGEWRESGDGFFDFCYCSRCGHKERRETSLPPLCPSCGARMAQ